MEKPRLWGAGWLRATFVLHKDKIFLENEGMQGCNPWQDSASMERGAILRIFRGKGQFPLISVFHTGASLAAGQGNLGQYQPSALPALGCSSGQVSEEC